MEATQMAASHWSHIDVDKTQTQDTES
jgi:hypothetical protein